MKKESWIEQTLSSAEGKKSQPVSASLKKRLASIPTEVQILNQTIPMRAIWLAAASLALLVMMNIFSIRQSKQKAQQADTSIYSTYFSYLDEI